MAICKKCKTLFFPLIETLKCPCVEFTVFDRYGDDYIVYAKNEQKAALAFAKRINEEHNGILIYESQEITINGNQYQIGATINYGAELQGNDK